MMFILFFYFKLIQCEIIIIPFTKTKSFNGDLYSYLYLNEYETIISIGTPMQKVQAYIKPNKHHLFILGSKISDQFNEYKSRTYEQKGIFEEYINEKPIKKGFISNETFFFNTLNGKIIQTDKISFVLATGIDKNENINSAQIGLGLYDSSLIKNQNLLHQLKLRNYIMSYSYFFQFDNDEKGKIIIGEKPHDYNNSYSNKIFNYLKVDSYDNVYHLKFEKVSINNYDVINKNVYAQFNFSFGGFITNSNNQKIFENLFFNKYIEKSLCTKENKQNFWIYYCEHNVNIAQFNIIKFYNLELNYTFEFNYKDLFKEYNGKYYFMILFSQEYYMPWILGQIFFQKYQIIIEQNKKILGIYINKPKLRDNRYIFSWIIILILLSLIIFMGILLYRRIKLIPKKIKANELYDEDPIINNYTNIIN